MAAITDRELTVASENLRYLRNKFHLVKDENGVEAVYLDYTHMNIPETLEEIAILIDRLQQERSEYHDRLDFLLKQCMKGDG